MTPPKPPRRRRIARYVARGLIGFIVLTGIGGVSSYFLLRTSLPELDGRIVLANGPSDEIEIVRDRYDIPHIHAKSAADAYYALGYVHAQDRLFQMEFSRRLGAGRLSEISGPQTLPIDRFMRTLGVYRLAEQSLKTLDPKTLGALKAYAAGVNAYLASRKGVLPIEFQLLRIVGFFRNPFGKQYKIEPWRPADSLVWGRVMALRLSSNFTTEAFRARLLKRLPPEMIDTLFPNQEDDTPATYSALFGKAASLFARVRDAVPEALKPITASNAWVVAGERTATGKPVLANDPHLGYAAPNLWYLARIETPNWTIAGATVPGVPFHILGHNDRIAWGFTTTESDTQDLFLERVTAGDPTHYDTPDGPRAFTTRREVIKVSGGDDEVLKVRETRHGPVISDVRADIAAAADDRYAVALATPALRADDRTPDALYRLDRAGNWSEFRDALRLFHSPHQTISYADVDGNIGFIAAARVPIRRSGRGLVPAIGWTGANDWTGFIPFDDLPQSYNPASDRIVSANYKVVPDDYPYWLGQVHTPSYRAQRIYQRLSAAGPQSTETSAALQNDDLSLMAKEIAPLLIAHTDGGDAQALSLLRAWDGMMAADRPEPLIFTAWLLDFVKAAVADELQDEFAVYYGYRPKVVKRILETDHRWCDDVTTPETETCNQIVTRSLAAAVQELKSTYGNDMKSWQWGDAHTAYFRHPIFGWLPVIHRLFDIEHPIGGGAYTVNRQESWPGRRGKRYASVHGPGYRAIYDLADLENSLMIQATGQSGNPLSSHYADLNPMWLDGDYVRLAGGDTEGAVGRLVLAPATP